MSRLLLIALAVFSFAACKQKNKCTFLGDKMELSDPKEGYPHAPKEAYRFLECGMDSIDCELMLPLAAVMKMDKAKEGRELRYGDVKETFDHMKDKNKDYYKAARKDIEERRHQ